jgi:signal transduction histidine kinase
MKQRSLKRVLGVQWALFGGVLLLGLCTLAAVALYVLEDSFIDARLLAAERALAGERQPLPQVELRRLGDFPERMHERLAVLAPGALREFRLADAHYVHLRALAPDAQGPRFLVFDAQDELRVSEGLWRAAPVLLALLLVLLLHALWLAHRFVSRIERAAAGLLDSLEREPSAASLRAASDAQPVAEFQRFGHALADSLAGRLAALRREEDTLRFLAHELRTPLQSARLALESMSAQVEGPAEARLRRALQRLERASAAVLWLGESTPDVTPMAIEDCARTLVDEFAPLAQRRAQTLRITVTESPQWPLPAAAAEAVLGNLLMNAIQHGAAGEIRFALSADSLEIRNACEAGSAQPGFGLGLELAKRLLAPIGWGLWLQGEGDAVCVRLAPLTAAPRALLAGCEPACAPPDATPNATPNATRP